MTDNVHSLTEKEKVELGLKGMLLLTAKIPNIPATPQESVDRVIDVHGELDQAEGNDNSKPGDNAVRLGTGTSQIQAGTEAKGSL